MAGTHELDRLLEELRQTSMNMAVGLPPPKSQYNSKSNYNLFNKTRKSFQRDEVFPENRYRSASVTGFGQDAHNFNEAAYHRNTSIYSDRLNGLTKSSGLHNHYSTTLNVPRHHSVFTTTLKNRPPVAPKRFNQVHLTIDPEYRINDVSYL